MLQLAANSDASHPIAELKLMTKQPAQEAKPVSTEVLGKNPSEGSFLP